VLRAVKMEIARQVATSMSMTSKQRASWHRKNLKTVTVTV